MSVGLGTIKADDFVSEVEVTAADYDADRLELEQDGNLIWMTRRQLQALSIIVDRFMDR